MNNKIFGLILVLILATTAGLWWANNKTANNQPVKIGIVTDLSGPAAYWGISTRSGAELAKQELEKGGYKVDLVFEDYQLDPAKAATAAQKLLNIDRVDAIYSDFNPGAISVSSVLKNQKVIHVYDAAIVSPLADSPYAFKTYLDYQEGCKQVAQSFKDGGIRRMGIIKANIEAGELCQLGIKEIYPRAISESYNLGDSDLNTQVLKLKSNQVEAFISAMFEADTMNALRATRNSSYLVRYGTVDDSITDKVKAKYKNELRGGISFGFSRVDSNFSRRLKALDPNLATEYAAAIAYTHIKQIVKAETECNKDIDCVVARIAASPADKTIGFNGFHNQIADLKMEIKKY